MAALSGCCVRAVVALARALVLALGPGVAAAQFNMVPPPQCPAPEPAASTNEEAYRLEAAQHLYECFSGRVYLGVLPPLVYGVMTVEADIDERGGIVTLSVVRKPAAPEIEPWLVALIRRAAPFPAPTRLPGRTVRLVETFFVDRSGLFQAYSLTEGQKGLPPAEVGSPLLTTPTP
jgi:hypothetical protein